MRFTKFCAEVRRRAEVDFSFSSEDSERLLRVAYRNYQGIPRTDPDRREDYLKGIVQAVSFGKEAQGANLLRKIGSLYIAG